MLRSPATILRFRAAAVGLTLLAHGAVVLLLVELERRAPRRNDAPQLQYVSIWTEPPRQTQPVAPARRDQPPEPVHRKRTLPPPLPSEFPSPAEPPVPATANRQISLQPPVDWNAAAADAARRFAEGNGGQNTFTPAPQPQRKPCKPRKFDADTEALMAERLPKPPDPDPVGADPAANCIIVGGYPKCVRKIGIPRRRSLLSAELLTQRIASKSSVPSVPSEAACE